MPIPAANIVFFADIGKLLEEKVIRMMIVVMG